jgi:hypothetical protein
MFIIGHSEAKEEKTLWRTWLRYAQLATYGGIHIIRRNKEPKTEPYTRRFRISPWEVLQKIDENITLQVSARGDGLCLYLPKDLTSLYGLLSGDRIKVALKQHYRKRREEQE